IAASKLKPKQLRLLKQLVRELARNLAPAVAAQQLAEIEAAGWDKVHFAWAGGEHVGDPHYFRITSPAALIEYDNTQNEANHVHLVWHSSTNDFANRWLKLHLESSDHAH
ncbi:MAG: DUF3500 domain-containing protein, partial [Planctomycetales bacterium]|nr:DUF3500 domain-containing protein [Planctomycetales bacterium]